MSDITWPLPSELKVYGISRDNYNLLYQRSLVCPHVAGLLLVLRQSNSVHEAVAVFIQAILEMSEKLED